MSLYKIAAYSLEKDAHLRSATFKKIGDKIHLYVDKDHLTDNEHYLLTAMQAHYNGQRNEGWDTLSGHMLFKHQAKKEFPKELLDHNFPTGNFFVHKSPSTEAAKEFFLANHHKIKGYKPVSPEHLNEDAKRYARDFYHNDMKKYEGIDDLVNHNDSITKREQQQEAELQEYFRKENEKKRRAFLEKEKQSQTNNKVLSDFFNNKQNNGGWLESEGKNNTNNINNKSSFEPVVW